MNKGRNLTKQFDRYASVPHVWSQNSLLRILKTRAGGWGGGGGDITAPKVQPLFSLGK